jgi:putative lipoic acid-binding regulatory protein
MNTPASQESLIEFPCEFPIKVMGSNLPEFQRIMLDLVKLYDPSLTDDKVVSRDSAKGNYVSLTMTVHAISQEQLDNIYRALSSHPLVKMAL